MRNAEHREVTTEGPRFDGPAHIRRPQRALERRLVRCMLLLIALPVSVCMLVFTLFLNQKVMQHRTSEGELLTAIIASPLASALADGWDISDTELVAGLSERPRVAFVCVTDASGTPVHVGVFDSRAWGLFQGDRDEGAQRWPFRITGTKVVRDRDGLLIVCSERLRQPVTGTESVGTAADPVKDATASNDRDLGTVFLGLKTTGVRATMVRYGIIQLGIILAAVMVSLPLLRWRLRRWTQPLRELVAATSRLAEGRPPKPVTYRSDDELGYLACAFNDMAARTIAGRRALIEANQHLETRVDERTAQLNRAVEQLNEAATTDSLTSVANRRAFESLLEEHFSISRRDHLDLSCALIDLDGFKPINDHLGHKMGDRLLILLGGLLKDLCRKHDIAARLGGDEFVILFPRTTPEKARTLCVDLMGRFEKEQHQLLSSEKAAVRASMSIGIVGLQQSQARDAEDLIRRADVALYEAKRQGKSRICVAGVEAERI